MRKIVILYSGGLDSFIMKKLAELQYPDHEVKCIYYRHGADSEQKEIDLLPDFVEVRTVDWLNETTRPVAKIDQPLAGAIYIPGRNLAFSVLAACQELPDQIWLGVLKDENNPAATDKNDLFRHSATAAISYALSPFKDGVAVVFPFVERGWTKVDAVNWALSVGVPKEDLLKTVSCWHAHDGKACGTCWQCVKRRLVFLNCGIDEVESDTDPIANKFGRKVISNIIKKVQTSPELCSIDELNMFAMMQKLGLTD